MDLRLEKVFKVGGGKDRIAVYADIANVFNSGTINRVVTRLDGTTVGTAESNPGCPCSVPFGGPFSLVAPRQVTLGARWSF